MSLLSSPFTVADENLKHSFSAAAPDRALTCNFGGRSWRPDKSYPDWGSILNARLYVDPEYLELKRTLMAKKFRATATAGSSLEVITLKVEGHLDEGVNNILRMYCPREGRGVPANVASVVVRCAVHHCKPLTAAPDHITAALATGALVVLWGVTSDVRYVQAQVPDVGAPVRAVEMMYYIKTRLSGEHLCIQQTIRVIGNPSYFKKPVRPFPSVAWM